MSYGLLERVLGRDGSHLLQPIPEAEGLETFPRPDGVLPEKVGTFGELKLLARLKGVVAGQERWQGRAVRAERDQLPFKGWATAPPSACAYLTSSPPYPRWPYNTANPPGTVSIFAQSTGDPSYPNAFSALAGAVSMWMGLPNTSLSLAYGGPISYTLTCTPDPNKVDVPGFGENVVVFNDPCSDLADLSGCSGVLGYGGAWYGTPHAFDGMSWFTIGSWFVVVNNGAGCLGAPRYQQMLAHELGHGLGFGHPADPQALMYYACCNSINATDTLCAQYTYPGNLPVPNPTPTPPPQPPNPTPPNPPPLAPETKRPPN
ncbi:MAG: hypothetical protein RMI39_05065, partial [Thermoanaerobaculum sp.]|nr:hypothetical protein [Thermoanaerobaculum sp.]